jgi:hypothetical protein
MLVTYRTRTLYDGEERERVSGQFVGNETMQNDGPSRVKAIRIWKKRPHKRELQHNVMNRWKCTHNRDGYEQITLAHLKNRGQSVRMTLHEDRIAYISRCDT